ncbi:unnamed protein product, partial [marine sediment metagenome]
IDGDDETNKFVEFWFNQAQRSARFAIASALFFNKLISRGRVETR